MITPEKTANDILCGTCGWTYGMICPECPGCGCCNGQCSEWRHEEDSDWSDWDDEEYDWE